MSENEPMSAKHLAAIRELHHDWTHSPGALSDSLIAATVMERHVPALLAEVERLRAEAILLRAQAESAGSLLLDVQRDCIEAKRQNAELLAEVERLSERERQLESECEVLARNANYNLDRREHLAAEKAALREIAQVVADMPDDWCDRCPFCKQQSIFGIDHAPDCVTQRARALLASPQSPASPQE